MRNVAMMLRKGQGVAKDPKKAEELYERAAEAGLPTAQADLADMLLKGEAGPPDLGAPCPCWRPPPPPTIPSPSIELGELYETGAPLVPQEPGRGAPALCRRRQPWHEGSAARLARAGRSARPARSAAPAPRHCRPPAASSRKAGEARENRSLYWGNTDSSRNERPL